MQHLINSCEFTGIIALLTIFHKYIQYDADWCQFISLSSSWSPGHGNVCTKVKIRNGHSSCTLSIFECQCHRHSKVLLHWRDFFSLYQSNTGAPTKPLSHFLKFPYTYLRSLANLCRIPCMYLLVHLTVSSMMSISMIFRYASSSVDASLA